jgi:hypothetical protein
VRLATKEGQPPALHHSRRTFMAISAPIPSRYLCLFLAQPQCLAAHDGPCLHALSTTCDQGEQHDSYPDSAVQRASAQSVRREDVVAAGGQEVIPCPPINIGADGILRALPISLTDQKRRDDLYRRRKQLEALSSRQQNSLNSASGLSNLVSCAMRRDVFECPRSRFYVQVDLDCKHWSTWRY